MASIVLKSIRRVTPGKSGYFLFFLCCFQLLLAGCFHLVSYYDSVTYQRLTDLKATTTIVFDKLSQDPTGASLKSDLDSLTLDIQKAYEYENGKDKNGETILQLSKILKMYNGTITLLQKDGKLSPMYITDKKDQMMTAFDIAIATEKSKIEQK